MESRLYFSVYRYDAHKSVNFINSKLIMANVTTILWLYGDGVIYTIHTNNPNNS